MPQPSVQAAFRCAFTRWGRPGQARLDNGCPWGSGNDLPTAFALWLVGLDVEPDFIAPRRPQDNGVAERSNGTLQVWAEAGSCVSVEQLQARLDFFDTVQRERYPRPSGQSRLQLFPGLMHSGRAFDGAWERRNWDLGGARQYLGGHVAVRQVSGQGQVSVYARQYGVGILHQGEQVWVQYDAADGQWLFAGRDGREWCRRPAEQITREKVMALDISAKPPNRLRGKTI